MAVRRAAARGRKAKRSFKKSYKKRFYKKKGSSLSKFKDVVSFGMGFPKKAMVTHKYFENVQLLSLTGSPATYQFCANDMYDPNLTGTGHQPYQYDQLATMYNHWHIIGAKITVKLVPYTASQAAAQVSIYQNDDTTPLSTDPVVQAEYAGSKYRVLTANSTDSVNTMVFRYSAKKTYGGSILSNTSLQGSVTASPSERTFWTISLKALDGSTTVQYFVNVKAEYTAVWSELKEVAQS